MEPHRLRTGQRRLGDRPRRSQLRRRLRDRPDLGSAAPLRRSSTRDLPLAPRAGSTSTRRRPGNRQRPPARHARSGISYFATGTQNGEVNIHGNRIIGRPEGSTWKIPARSCVLGKTWAPTRSSAAKNPRSPSKALTSPATSPATPCSKTRENLILLNDGRVAATPRPGNAAAPRLEFVELCRSLQRSDAENHQRRPGCSTPNIYRRKAPSKPKAPPNPRRLHWSPKSSAGEWNHIAFGPGSGSSVIDHVEVTYGKRDRDARGQGLPPRSPTRLSAKEKHADSGYLLRAPGNRRQPVSNTASGLFYWHRQTLRAQVMIGGCASGPKPPAAATRSPRTSNGTGEPPPNSRALSRQRIQCGEGRPVVSPPAISTTPTAICCRRTTGDAPRIRLCLDSGSAEAGVLGRARVIGAGEFERDRALVRQQQIAMGVIEMAGGETHRTAPSPHWLPLPRQGPSGSGSCFAGSHSTLEVTESPQPAGFGPLAQPQSLLGAASLPEPL